MPFHFLLISCFFLPFIQRSLCVNSFPIAPDTWQGEPLLTSDVILPPDVLNIHHHHHHHHAVPVARSLIPFPTKLVIQRRTFFDEALAFKVGLGLGTVGGAAGGAAAGTGVGAIGATILGKTALKTTKLIFGKYKIPVPVKLPLPVPIPLPLPLPLPLPIPIIIPKLLSIHKGIDTGYHHHHREDERPRDDADRSHYDRDRYEAIQRDDDRRDYNKATSKSKEEAAPADNSSNKRKVSTSRKVAQKKITKTKKRKGRGGRTTARTTAKPKSQTLQLSKGISISFTRR